MEEILLMFFTLNTLKMLLPSTVKLNSPYLQNLDQLSANISDMHFYPQIIFIGHQKNIHMNLYFLSGRI